MTSSATELEIRVEGSAAVIDLAGDVDASAEESLLAAFDRASGLSRKVILNFSTVGYINSTGIALIVGLLARARKEGRPIGAFGLSDHYLEIFTITRVADFMTIYTDEAKALGDTDGGGDHA